ncbi:MAG: restriction endonuclease [Planctomycetes bacterium]|nr:restriction endonuclease [Planctomycetota bacterium]
MVAMGYGGTLKDAGEAIGGSGDEGVDGVTKEDRLGLDLIYLQAKRWKDGNTVGRPELQKFVGALDGKRAHKAQAWIIGHVLRTQPTASRCPGSYRRRCCAWPRNCRWSRTSSTPCASRRSAPRMSARRWIRRSRDRCWRHRSSRATSPCRFPCVGMRPSPAIPRSWPPARPWCRSSRRRSRTRRSAAPSR